MSPAELYAYLMDRYGLRPWEVDQISVSELKWLIR